MDNFCKVVKLNAMEKIASGLGFELVISKHDDDKWYIDQYISGPAIIDTPFLIDKDERGSQFWLNHFLTDSGVDYA